MRQKVAIVGAGNVGKALREGLERTGYKGAFSIDAIRNKG